MTTSEPSPADHHAKAQIDELIAYAEQSGQTLLAALLSQAADVLDEKVFMSRSDDS